MKTPDIVGLDPSLAATGVATMNGTLMTVTDKNYTGDHRLVNLARTVRSLTADVVVMEDLPVNAKSAGKTGMAQGVIREALLARSIPFILITPATLKKFATGKGNSDKAAMRASYNEHTGHDNRDDNQVDAFYLREIGLYLSGQAPSKYRRLHATTPEAVDSLKPHMEAALDGFLLV